MRNRRRRRQIAVVAADLRVSRCSPTPALSESLEQRALLSSIITEISDGPRQVDVVRIVQDNGHDGTVTVAWNDYAGEVDLPTGWLRVVEYEIQLTNEGQTVDPFAYGTSETSGDVEFRSMTATNTRTILRRERSTVHVEVAPGEFDLFHNSTAYSLGPGIYSLTVRYRLLPAFTTDPAGFGAAPANGLATKWSDWSDSRAFSVIPQQQAYLVQVPDRILKTGTDTRTGDTRIAQQRHRIAWGFESAAESYEVWISREGEGRVFHHPAMTVNGLDINSDYKAGKYSVWVKANPVENIATGLSPPVEFEIVDGGSAYLITESHPPDEPLRLHFGYTGLQAGSVRVRIYASIAGNTEPLIDETFSAVTTRQVAASGLPSGLYYVVVQQLIGDEPSGPPRDSRLHIIETFMPQLTGGRQGQINTLSWPSGSADRFNVWVSYDGPLEESPVGSQRPQFRYQVAQIESAGTPRTTFRLPADAPTGNYRAWIEGLWVTSRGRLSSPGDWSDTFSFSIQPPMLQVRVSDDAFRSAFATIDWDEIPGAVSYSVNILQSGAVFQHNGLPQPGLVRKFVTDQVRNDFTVTDATEWTIPVHMRAGHYVARVTALLASGETISEEAFFSHRVPVLSEITYNNGIHAALQPVADSPQYQFHVAYMADGADRSNFDWTFYTTRSSSHAVHFPSDWLPGTYRIWGQARLGTINTGSWSDWSAPADFVIPSTLTITSRSGTWASLPHVEWESNSTDVLISVRDAETGEIFDTETVRNTNQWNPNRLPEGRGFRILVTPLSPGGVPGQQRSIFLKKQALPELRFEPHLSNRVSWLGQSDAESYDIWISLDAADDLSAGSVNRNFRFLVQSRIQDLKVFLPADAPNGQYRAWVRYRGASDLPSAWTAALEFSVATSEPPAGSVVHPPGVQHPTAGIDVHYLYSSIDRASTPVIEAVPDPEVPSVVRVHRETSAGPLSIEWQNSTERSPEYFLARDGLLVTARQMQEVELVIRDLDTGRILTPDGGQTRDDSVNNLSTRILVWHSEDRILPQTLNLATGNYSLSLRYRTLRVLEHDEVLQEKVFTGSDGVVRIPMRNTAENGRIKAISSDWSQWSALFRFTTANASRPVILDAASSGQRVTWLVIPEAARYEIFAQERLRGEQVRRVVEDSTFDLPSTGDLFNVSPVAWRVWVRVFSPGGYHGPWSEVYEYRSPTLLD